MPAGFSTTDTVAAIATAAGESGIGIIRISGEEALPIADRVLDRSILDAGAYTIHYRHAVTCSCDNVENASCAFPGRIQEKREILDDVLVSVMLAPHSYTGENTVEINCHGGSLVLQRVLEEVLKAGARPAGPGEFSKRAFLNGKMDLSQAEAVMDLIQAKNRYAMEAAVSQLQGGLSDKVRELREEILNETAWIEAALDDPEHYDLTGYPEELGKKLGILVRRLENLIENAESGKVMKEGISTVILGKPNAGKSSLLNLLAGEDRAIVTEIAGTTRDTLTEHIRMAGLSLNLTDTAGIRESTDRVEQIGVEKARKAAADADLLLVMIDGSVPLDKEDREILASSEGKQAVILLNKSDLPQIVTAEEIGKMSEHKVIVFSAKDGTGLPEMEETVRYMFYHNEINFNDQIYVTSARHKNALEQALRSLKLVQNSIFQGLPEDFFSIDLQDAYQSLGEITGETVGDDVIDRIFERFCTGK